MAKQTIAIDAELHTELKIKAAIEQRQIGEVVNALVRQYVMQEDKDNSNKEVNNG